MGLLDDAIREHLELKRQHGADPSEVDRLEHEALGPVRRRPLEPANQESVPHDDADDRSVAAERPSEPSDVEYEDDYYDEAETGDWGEAFEEDFQPPGSRPPGGPRDTPDLTTAEPPASREHEAERGLRRWRRSRKGSIPPEESPPTQADPPVDVSHGDETAEYGVDEALARRRGESDEKPAPDQPTTEEEADVLEETPEFLQDAPEHDRLWFEQRPPRDFDFDD